MRAITLERIEADWAVDPLFKKTCSDFDETGIAGLLCNNLHANNQIRLIFDSSDNISELPSSQLENTSSESTLCKQFMKCNCDLFTISVLLKRNCRCDAFKCITCQ